MPNRVDARAAVEKPCDRALKAISKVNITIMNDAAAVSLRAE